MKIQYSALFYSLLLYCCLGNVTTSQAQNKATIIYAKDSSSIIKLHHYLHTAFAFTPPSEFPAVSELPIELRFQKATVVLPTRIEEDSQGRPIMTGELPPTLFNARYKGHIAFGKAILHALDTLGADSIVTLQTTALAYPNINGPMYLDLKGMPGSYQAYWNEVEYYWLFDKKAMIQDSMERTQADIKRAEALNKASERYLNVTAESIESGERELNRKFSTHKLTFERLKKVNGRIDELLDKTRRGEELSAEERNEVTYLTTDGSSLKKELGNKSNGKEALALFNKVSRSYTQNKNAKQQFEATKISLLQKQEKLQAFQVLQSDYEVRLQTLKRLLKF